MALTREQFAWIVTQRATFITPEAVVINFARQFKAQGATITPADVAKAERDALPAEWQSFFDTELAKFLDAPTAKLEVRVAELNRLYVRERDRGAACAQYLEQIAKEMAGAYAPKGAPGAKAGGEPRQITEIIETIVDPAPQPEPAK
jgi:hypothetical protein